MKFISKTLVAAAVALSAPAFAAIAPTTTGDGELFVVIFNPTVEASLTLDLGVTINNFRAAYDFNTAATIDTKTWTLDGNNAEVKKFVAKAGATSGWNWYVQAGDSVGSTSTFGGRGLLTTLSAAHPVSKILETTNGSYNSIFAPVNSFLASTLLVGDADMTDAGTAKNGYSYGDPSNGAYALSSGFAGTDGAGFAKFTNDNSFAVKSEVFYVTRNAASNLATVKIDQFDNKYGNSTFALATAGADYTLTFATATAPIPEPGTYALLLAGLAMVGMLARRRQA